MKGPEWRTAEQIAFQAMQADKALAAIVHNIAYEQGNISAENKARIYRRLAERCENPHGCYCTPQRKIQCPHGGNAA